MENRGRASEATFVRFLRQDNVLQNLAITGPCSRASTGCLKSERHKPPTLSLSELIKSLGVDYIDIAYKGGHAEHCSEQFINDSRSAAHTELQEKLSDWQVTRKSLVHHSSLTQSSVMQAKNHSLNRQYTTPTVHALQCCSKRHPFHL